MKHGTSLVEERQALLEQIHARRAAYRRMLSNEIDLEAAGTPHVNANQAGQKADFPRSKTVRWIMQHPYASAAGLVAVALLLPKAVSGSKHASHKSKAEKRSKSNRHAGSQAYIADRSQPMHSPYPREQNMHDPYSYGPYPQPVYIQEPTSKKAGAAAGVAAFGGTALTTLITVGTMILRDPAKLRMAMRMLDSASEFIRKNRRGSAAQPSVRGDAVDMKSPGTTGL